MVLVGRLRGIEKFKGERENFTFHTFIHFTVVEVVNAEFAEDVSLDRVKPGATDNDRRLDRVERVVRLLL